MASMLGDSSVRLKSSLGPLPVAMVILKNWASDLVTLLERRSSACSVTVFSLNTRHESRSRSTPVPVSRLVSRLRSPGSICSRVPTSRESYISTSSPVASSSM